MSDEICLFLTDKILEMARKQNIFSVCNCCFESCRLFWGVLSTIKQIVRPFYIQFPTVVYRRHNATDRGCNLRGFDCKLLRLLNVYEFNGGKIHFI